MDTKFERIKEIFSDSKLSQEKFGERIGLSKSSVSGVINGKQNISDNVLNNIVREFCVKEAWLNDGIGEKYDERRRQIREIAEDEMVYFYGKLKSDQKDLLGLLKGSSDEEQALILASLRTIYTMLLYRNGDVSYLYYRYLLNIMLELSKYIENMNNYDTDPVQLASIALDRIKDEMQSICRLTCEPGHFFMAGYGTGKSNTLIKLLKDFELYNGYDDEKAGLFNLYSDLDENDQEEIITLMALKLKRDQGRKRKQSLPKSAHGEEAATDEVVTKKMA